MDEKPRFKVKEELVLEKFDGEPEPENLVEKIFLEDGKIIKHQFIENGEVVREVT